MPVLAAIASATSTIRLGTLVLNNDMRNPVQLAWDVATIDAVSYTHLRAHETLTPISYAVF